MAAHVFLVYFFAILWKTTTWNDQILVWRTWTTTAEFLIFFHKLIAESWIQFRFSFDSDKHGKWL